MAEMSIYQRIDAAYSEIGKAVFRKTGKVQGSASYNFIPIDQLLNIVRQAHAKYGVKVLFGKPEYDPEQGEFRREVREERQSPYGQKYTSVNYYAVGHMAVRLIGGSEDDCIETVIGFEARDNSDKLTNKIYTNAERSLYRTLYAIDEGSPDPEAENIENVVSEPAPAKAVSDPFFTKDTKKKAPAKTPAKTSKRPIAKAHLTYDYQPIPNGSLRTMGPDYTGREPEEDGYVHLRDRRSIDEEQVMRCYHSDDGFVVKPFVDRYGPVIQKWTEDQLSEALNAMASNDLLDGQEGGQ